MTILKNFFRQDEGVTALEYGMIAALIAVVIIFAVQAVGQDLLTTFNLIAANI